MGKFLQYKYILETVSTAIILIKSHLSFLPAKHLILFYRIFMLGGKLIQYQYELKWYTFIISFTAFRGNRVIALYSISGRAIISMQPL